MAEFFVQYKGTDICMDFYCECGKHLHYDGYGAYAVKCPHCLEVFELQQIVEAKKVSESETQFTPILLEVDDDY